VVSDIVQIHRLAPVRHPWINVKGSLDIAYFKPSQTIGIGLGI
jgi:hypothetical protein